MCLITESREPVNYSKVKIHSLFSIWNIIKWIKAFTFKIKR